MTKQEQINRLQFRIERIENELGLVQPDYFAMPIKSNLSEIPNSCEHLLPAGYEFCKEGEHTDWVKVNDRLAVQNFTPIGGTNKGVYILESWKPYYRPIRPIQYHVAVHEAVTTEPNPYAVDWSNAPEWADSHAFDEEGKGRWYGTKKGFVTWIEKSESSNFRLSSNLDWFKSKTTRP